MRQDSKGNSASAPWRLVLAGVVLAGGAVFAAPEAAHAIDTATKEGQRMEFTVTLGGSPNGWAVRYKYETRDNAAVQGEDYERTTGVVTFSSGVKEQKVYVQTLDDSEEEYPEVFRLYLYDQEVNGLHRGVEGWVSSTLQIRGMPKTITLRGQIMDNDGCVKTVSGKPC